MQKTIDGFGLDALVESARHVDDVVDGPEGPVRFGDAFLDAKGAAHRTIESRHDRDVDLVTEFFDDVDKWVTEYSTSNEDYPAGYSECIDSSGWKEEFVEWIETKHGERFDGVVKDIAGLMVDRVDESFCDLKYQSNEYAGYYGDGLSLFSIDIGEIEEQTEVHNDPVLCAIHSQGRLDDVLDDVRSDSYISRDRPRVKNSDGVYEYVGRETYEHGNDPYIMTYHNPGGRWFWVLPDKEVEELYVAAIIELAGSV